MKADHAQNISSRKPLVIYTQCHALYTTIGYDQDSATKTDVFSRWSYTFEVTFDIYKKQAYRLIMARPNDLGFGPTTDLATKQDALSTNPHCSSKGQGPEAATPSCWKERIDTRRNSNWPPPCCVKTVGFFITIQPLEILKTSGPIPTDVLNSQVQWSIASSPPSAKTESMIELIPQPGLILVEGGLPGAGYSYDLTNVMW